MTPEGKVKRKISELLKKHGCYYEMPVPTGFGKSGLDYTAAHKGLFFSIEAKAANKQPTARQELTIAAIRKAGGRAFVVNEVSGMDELEMWLREV